MVVNKLDKKTEQEQDEKTTISIARLVKKYKEREDVDCIYFLPYIEENFDNHYYVIVVFKKLTDEIEKGMNKYNKSHASSQAIEAFGGEIKVLPDVACYYSDAAMGIANLPEGAEWTGEMIRAKDLMAGAILYDRTGHYSKIVEEGMKHNTEEAKQKVYNINNN